MHQLGASLIDEERYKATYDAPAARKVRTSSWIG